MPPPSLPPPLPSSLSNRFLSTINPHTGTCKRHPSVQLCELGENNSRWIVRRKICSKCGARALGGRHHTPGVAVRKGSTPRRTMRSHSAPPASDGRQSAAPVRLRLSCDERQGEPTPNLAAKSFKSRSTTSTSLSFSNSGSGGEITSSTNTKFEAENDGKHKASRKKNNKKSDEDKPSIANIDGSEHRLHRRTSRIRDNVSPRHVSFNTPPKIELHHIPPPPFHNQVKSQSRSKKKSSIITVEDDIIKNVGCIYFYPTYETGYPRAWY